MKSKWINVPTCLAQCLHIKDTKTALFFLPMHLPTRLGSTLQWIIVQSEQESRTLYLMSRAVVLDSGLTRELLGLFFLCQNLNRIPRISDLTVQNEVWKTIFFFSSFPGYSNMERVEKH